MSDPTRPSRFTPKLVVGLAVLALGIVLLLENLRLYDAWHLLNWWPLVLAALGAARLRQDGILSLRGHVWLGLAVAGFISQFGPWGILDRWWPLFLVWGGLVVSLRAAFSPRIPPAAPAPPPAPAVESAVLAPTCDPGTSPDKVNP